MNTEVPVQMVMPELNAGQHIQNESANSSSQSAAVMHSNNITQSPLQQQMQAMQQNLNSSTTGSVQMVMSELNSQVQMVQNDNIAANSSNQPTLMHHTATMAQAPMQHVQVIPQAMSTPYFQSVYSPQQQVIFPGNLTLHTGTGPMVQSIAQNANVQLQAKPDLLNKVSVTGPTYQIVNAVTTKAYQAQNLLSAKSMYTSSVPVNSTQVSNANQLKQMTSQPQMMTTQAPSGAIYQPQQIFGPFTQLPQNITWATPGTYQSPTLLSANVIIRNQQPDMYIQPSPQAMLMPVAPGTTQLPGGFTYALVQQQKPQQIATKQLSLPQTQHQKSMKVRNISPSVATQTNTNDKMKIAIPRSRVNQNTVRPRTKIALPLQYNTTISSILPQQVPTDAQCNVQLEYQLESTNQLDVNNQSLPNLTKPTISTETQSQVLQTQLVTPEIIQSTQPKPDIINVPSNIAQMTISSAINKPVAMVIASTVTTTLPVNTVVTSPIFTTPPVAAPIVSSIETPLCIPPCPPVSSSFSNSGEVSDSTANDRVLSDSFSMPLIEINNENGKTTSIISETHDSISELRISDNLKANSCDGQTIAATNSENIVTSNELSNIDVLKPQSKINASELKRTNVLKSQTCDSEQQTALSVLLGTTKTPIILQKKSDKVKNQKFLSELAKITPTPQKPAETSVLKPNVAVPETHAADCIQGNDEVSKECTKYDLDIVIKTEPVELSPAKVENEINFKAVAQKEVVVNQADSSVTFQKEKKIDNRINSQSESVELSTVASTVESKVISDIDAKSKTDGTESSHNKTENMCIENQTDDSMILKSESEKPEVDKEVCQNVAVEHFSVSKTISEKECDGRTFKNAMNEIIIEREPFLEEQSENVPQNLMSPPHVMERQKQRLKAVVRPHVLTHVIDGFVIYESSEPFPVNKSALMTDSCDPIVPKIADSSKKHKGSKHLSVKNPDEPTKPDDLKEPNEPTKTDFPKKRSDRIKLLETQKQLDLKKLEPKKSSEQKKAVEPKTPTEKKAPADWKSINEPKKIEDPKKMDESANDKVSPSGVNKSNQVASENIPKTPGKRGRKRKELRSRRGRKKLIPDVGGLNNTSIEIIVIDGENGLESDTVDDESASATEIASPVQTSNTEEKLQLKSPVENSSAKPTVSEIVKEPETNKIKTFAEKLPTEWTVEDVCDFVRHIPNCQDYAEEFKSQEIDGKALLLLKVDHIVTFTSMKFGPALKLISLIDDMKEKYSLEV